MSEQESPAEERDGSQNPGTDEGLQGTVKLLIGRIASVLGILAGVGGVVAALAFDSTDITPAAAAILLGVVGYFLGARRLEPYASSWAWWCSSSWLALARASAKGANPHGPPMGRRARAPRSSARPSRGTPMGSRATCYREPRRDSESGAVAPRR